MVTIRSQARARFRFAGAIDPGDMVRFAASCVGRLDLRLESRLDAESVVCEVLGQPDLVDAFEMACLLGPPGSLVTRCERVDLPPGGAR